MGDYNKTASTGCQRGIRGVLDLKAGWWVGGAFAQIRRPGYFGKGELSK
jgi:hypothetical protein